MNSGHRPKAEQDRRSILVPSAIASVYALCAFLWAPTPFTIFPLVGSLVQTGAILPKRPVEGRSSKVIRWSAIVNIAFIVLSGAWVILLWGLALTPTMFYQFLKQGEVVEAMLVLVGLVIIAFPFVFVGLNVLVLRALKRIGKQPEVSS